VATACDGQYLDCLPDDLPRTLTVSWSYVRFTLTSGYCLLIMSFNPGRFVPSTSSKYSARAPIALRSVICASYLETLFALVYSEGNVPSWANNNALARLRYTSGQSRPLLLVRKRTYPIPVKLPTPVTMHTLSFSRCERGRVERCAWSFSRRRIVAS